MRPDDTVSPDEAFGLESATWSEKDFQARVRAIAEAEGWMVYAVWDSRRTPPGWPDLTLVRGSRLCFWELKSQKRGRVSEAQRRWLAALAATGVETAVYRPGDFDVIAQSLRS